MKMVTMKQRQKSSYDRPRVWRNWLALLAWLLGGGSLLATPDVHLISGTHTFMRYSLLFLSPISFLLSRSSC